MRWNKKTTMTKTLIRIWKTIKLEKQLLKLQFAKKMILKSEEKKTGKYRRNWNYRKIETKLEELVYLSHKITCKKLHTRNSLLNLFS